jgi:hypothetical protein
LPVRVSSGRLWEGYEIKDRAKLGALIILERAPIAEVEFSQLSGGEIPVDELLRMNFTEARHFIRLVQPFSGQGFDRGWLEEWKERESDLLRSYSRRSPVYRLRLPQDVSRKDGIGVRLLQLLEPVLREKELGSSHG